MTTGTLRLLVLTLPALGLAGALLVVGFLWQRENRNAYDPDSPQPVAGGSTTGSPASYEQLVTNVAGARIPAHTRFLLDQWRAHPDATNAHELAACVASGLDAPLPGPLALSPAGELTGAPTLRLYVLDLWARQDPAPALTWLSDHPEAVRDTAAFRAACFARADLSDPALQRLVESYLLQPDHTPAELDAFVQCFTTVQGTESRRPVSAELLAAWSRKESFTPHGALLERLKAPLNR